VSNYPPYNIARTGGNAYRISVAVAGFTDADLSIEAKENTLTIRGERRANDEESIGRRANWAGQEYCGTKGNGSRCFHN
jgi:HSP20 family molecular chaperone IbpA